MSKIISVILAFSILLILSCSTQKNTLITRNYHALTSKYNILFNANESFKKGIHKLEKNIKNDYTAILPIFIGGDEKSKQFASSDMDFTIKKCEKLIALHSITVKPKINTNKPLSLKQREFLNKKEYNILIDEAYLLMAKAYYYKNEKDKSIKIFQFIINEYDDQQTILEAKIWLAKIFINNKSFLEAKDILDNIDKRNIRSKKLLKEYYLVQADYFLGQKNYNQAINNLKLAIELENRNFYKSRYYFILGQMFNTIGNSKQAIEAFKNVIKLKPQYEMFFYSQINIALSYQKGTTSVREIEKNLLKMLNDEKNKDYYGQIYFALGNLYLRNNDTTKAIDYYQKSTTYGKTNTPEKVEAYITIGDIFYNKKNYLKAQLYYDSAVNLMESNHIKYKTISTRAKNLNKLVKEYNTYLIEDSLQRLAKLPYNELINYIDKIIEKVREEERQKILAKQNELENSAFARQLESQSRFSQTSGGKWYFYNDVAREQGYKEFKLKWGNRPLEDNWRRKNKTPLINVAQDINRNNGDINKTKENSITNENTNKDNKSREFYLQKIPLSDSAFKNSLSRAEKALFNTGLIYKNELNDLEEAAKIFRIFINKYGDSELRPSVLYQLYSIYKLQQNEALANVYKNMLIQQYPNSTYSITLSNPDYYKKIEEKEKEIEKYYQETYKLFTNQQYDQVIAKCNYAINNYKEYPEYSMLFDYLKVLTIGKTSSLDIFRNELNRIIKQYPGTQIAKDANSIIVAMDRKKPEIKEKEETQAALITYNKNENETHYMIFSVPLNFNINQLNFNVLNFNLDFFDNKNLTIDRLNFNNEILLVIKSFKNKNEALEYFKKIINHKDIYKDTGNQNVKTFVINESNFKTLQQEKNTSKYLKFFLQYYLN